MTSQNKPVYNGRINVMEPDIQNLFNMYDRIPVNEPASFRDATKGILKPSKLSEAYFSAENMKIIQNGIKAGVYNKSGGHYVIPDQNTDTLKIIMRSIYLQHSINMPNNIPQQIQNLNDLVLAYAIPQVYNATVSHLKYLKDVSTMPTPMDKPKLPYETKELPVMNYGFTKEYDENRETHS